MAIEDVRANKTQLRALQIYLESGGDKVLAYESTRNNLADVSQAKRSRRAKNWFATPTMRKLLKEADTQTLINMKRTEIAGVQTAIEKYGISKERIMAELAKIAFANATDVMTWGPDGVLVKDSSDIGDAAAAVKEVSTSGGGDKPLNVKVALLDKRQALIDLGKEIGMFKEKVEHSGGVAVAAKFVIEGREMKVINKPPRPVLDLKKTA